MFDYKGKRVQRAYPSTPVSVMGLNEVPHAGDLFIVVGSDREARTIISEKHVQENEIASQQSKKITLEELYNQIQSGEARELRLVVKADVQGSLEPIVSSINDLSNDRITVNILHAETGIITENDVMLAAASKAIVIGFNVEPDSAARRLAESEGVSIRTYNIIYRLTEDLEKAQIGRAHV